MAKSFEQSVHNYAKYHGRQVTAAIEKALHDCYYLKGNSTPFDLMARDVHKIIDDLALEWTMKMAELDAKLAIQNGQS